MGKLSEIATPFFLLAIASAACSESVAGRLNTISDCLDAEERIAIAVNVYESLEHKVDGIGTTCDYSTLTIFGAFADSLIVEDVVIEKIGDDCYLTKSGLLILVGSKRDEFRIHITNYPYRECT